MILQRISCPPTWKNIVISSPGVLGPQQISHRSIRSLCVSALLRFEVIKKAKSMADQASLFGSDNTPSVQKNRLSTTTAGEPLAARMRPYTLEEIVGQEHILGPGKALRRSIEGDTITSMILWGPPGSGKTTLAEVIARQTHAHFVRLSAVSAGVADLRKVVEDAKRLSQFSGQRTILFIDEIHRFNKAQQDAVFPLVVHGV